MPQSEIDHDELRRWLRATLGFSLGEISIEPLAGDVSTRRYYRVRSSDERAVVAWYPEDLRGVALRFERSTELLERAGIRVPAIRLVDRERGLMLLEDVGSATLFDWRDRPWESIEPWLRAAHRAALRLRDIDPAEVAVGLLPPLDAAALERELAMTWDVFLLPSGLVGDDALSRRLRSQLGALCAALQASGMVPCHRDLMARNLVPIEASGEVVLLDHQDLRLGPSTYDAASLFNDSLYPAEERVETMVGGAIYRSGAYHRAVAQRSLKIVGTFASFARRGQPRHLPLIPISLRRGLDHLAALPETTSLAADLERKWAKALC
jgi:aminoglycoside/choline kinase family phosphotransferase